MKLLNAAARAVAEQFSESELTAIAAQYVKRMRGVYDDLSEQERLDAAVEEVLADANGRMLRYEDADATKFTQTVWQILNTPPVQKSRPAAQDAQRTAEKYSVVTLPDGKQFVKADRMVLFGNDPREWRVQLEDYINGKIRRGEDVVLIGADGDELVLTETSAGKLSTPYTSDGRTMSEEAYERKSQCSRAH